MAQIVFVHGMFQNPKSWDGWMTLLRERGHDCVAPAWPLHEGDPAALRANPPPGLGDLRLAEVLASIESVVASKNKPVVIGHSVGGLIAQLLLNKGLVSRAVGIDSVAPNAMLEFDWGFLKNSAIIANPLKGDEPAMMDEKTFHAAFANTMSEADSAIAYQRTATHDSRNVLRDCMGSDGHVDLKKPHGPLLLIGGEKDQIIPAELSEKNAKAYDPQAGEVTFKAFAGRGHFICGEPGWQEVANFVADWIGDARDNAAATPLGSPRL